MKLQLIRHATLWLQYGGVNFLVDPMLSDAGANPPIVNSADDRRNPLVPLPAPAGSWLLPDAVLLTHLHRDHWDEAAAAALGKDVPVLCQPGDEKVVRSQKFHEVHEINGTYSFEGVDVTRTRGKHGTGLTGLKMGQVSGYVLRAEGEPTLYIAGDTIWCRCVQEVLDAHRPDVTVVNAGGARFATGDPITMDGEDVAGLCRYAPYTKVVAVHMDAINHCLVTRADLAVRLTVEGLRERVLIPGNGEWI